MNNLQTIDSSSLLRRDYLSIVDQYPILSYEEESELLYKYHINNDLEAARRLTLCNLRFVVSIAKNYRNYGLPEQDLIQEGIVGLMKAIKSFDINEKCRLLSYAAYWIKAEIYEYILHNWGVVKIATTKAQRKLFFNLRKLRSTTSKMCDKEVATIADQLNVTSKDVMEMEHRFRNYDNSSEDDFSVLDSIPDTGVTPEVELEILQYEQLNQRKLKEALSTLDERSLDIINSRWLSEDKVSLVELSEKYNISKERVRQLEVAAIKKLKEFIIE